MLAVALLFGGGDLSPGAFAATRRAVNTHIATSTIYACVRNKGGTIRITTQRRKCKRRERKLSWSTTGPAGAAGPQGSQGFRGAPGPQGSGGAAGQRRKTRTESGDPGARARR